MSVGSNRARAKRAAKRRGSPKRARSGSKRPTPSTAPYEAAAALTGDDVGDLQRAREAAPTAADLAQLDQAAAEIERPHTVTLTGACPNCGRGVTLREAVRLPELAGTAAALRGLRDKLAKFDGRVLRRLIDNLGKGASLWFTGKRGK